MVCLTLTGVKTVENDTMGKDDCEKPCIKKGATNGNQNKPREPDRKKHIQDHCFHTGSTNLVSECDDDSQFIASHMKKTCVRGNDVAEALRKSVKPDTENGNLL